ncbi:MAG: hypothetical protein R3E91_00910 [Chlamydiales bacterium]
MKILLVSLFLSLLTISPLEAYWCGRPCLRDRYYNPGWADSHQDFYGYININDYPYTLPVNRYFNPSPYPISRFYDRNHCLSFRKGGANSQKCSRCHGDHRSSAFSE